MNLGVWMSPAVLEHKIECATDGKSPEVPWNVRRLPEGFGREPGPRRLYVASNGAWRGFFMLSDEVLFNPDDAAAPISLMFDSRTWTLIEPIPVARFRGVTANVPPREFVRVRQ